MGRARPRTHGSAPAVLALLLVSCGARLGSTGPEDAAHEVAPAARAAPLPAGDPERERAPVSSLEDRPIGSAHPTNIDSPELRVSPDGGALVVCQAREDTDGDGTITTYSGGMHDGVYGDELAPYLVIGHGEGRRIEGALIDRGNRWGIVREGVLEILDPRRPDRIEATIPTATIASASAAGFDDEGTGFVYIGTEPEAVVLVDLRDGSQRVLPHGSGHPIAARFVGAEIEIETQRSAPRHQHAWQPPVSCPRGAPSCVVEPAPPRPRTRVVRVLLDGSLVRPDPAGLIVELPRGPQALRRLDDGSVVWNHRGEATEVIPKGCHGQVAHVHEPGGGVLACCRRGGAGVLEWHHPEQAPRRLELACEAGRESPQAWGGRGRLVTRPDADADTIVDLVTGQAIPLERRYNLLLEHGDKSYLEDLAADVTLVVDWRSAEARELPLRFGYVQERVRAGRWIHTRDGLLVDLELAEVVGTTGDRPRPLAITESGRLLMPSARGGTRIRPGPLRWETANPIE